MKAVRSSLAFLLLVLSAGGTQASQDLELSVGESRVMESPDPSGAVVGNPDLVEISPVGGGEFMLTGKAPGRTALSYRATSGGKATRNVRVNAGDAGRSLIEMKVEVLEVDTQSALKAGLNWGSLSDAKSLQDSLTVSEVSPPPLRKIGELQREGVAASLQLLMDRGRARLLARPRLVVADGEEASFLAGGEIPYVTENKNGGTNVEFKPYGVKLVVKPRMTAGGRVRARVRTEVSGLDVEKAVAVAGVAVPAIRTRWTETTVEARSGATLVLAGMIQDETQVKHSGLPLLSDIPILGGLFRTTHEVKAQTELVVFLTPSLSGRSAE